MLKFSVNLSLLFRERPLLERFASARAAGFGAAEIQVPYEWPAGEIARAANEASLPVVLINAPLGPDSSSPGMACRPEHRAAFRESLERAAEYAEALRAPCVNVLTGRAAGAEREQCLGLLVEHLSLAAEVLARVGSRPLLEMINPHDVPGYCITSFDAAMEILSRSDPRLGLQFDIYHAARLGLDPAAAFSAVHERVAHVQFADSPGRHEPGTGALDFNRIFAAIEQTGYTGWLGAEYHPSVQTADTLDWLRTRCAPQAAVPGAQDARGR
ncbi:MAG TPA: TIM barrel protein [Steroidobacteraceae bacterium]|nr:TIM barrel protein [Steroidobacteraceae bacterium]